MNTRYEVHSKLFTLRPQYGQTEWRKWLGAVIVVAVVLAIIVGIAMILSSLGRGASS